MLTYFVIALEVIVYNSLYLYYFYAFL